ncbi:MAG: SMP-30/gluconolactonase/LRE family protein [Cellvibrio sp.]
MLKKYVATLLIVGGISGCGAKQEVNVVSSSAADDIKVCGVAPSGEYIAQRIPHTELTGEFQGLYEGPVWVNGALYYSHFSFERGFPSRILRLKDDREVSVMVKSSGSNGLTLDHEGNLVAAAHAVKGLLRFDRNSGDQSIVIDSYNENPFNSPNDLVFTRTGVAYFTDPDFQKAAAPGGQPVTGVYQVKDGKALLIDGSLKNPNGIALSADETKLYVAGGEENGVLREYTLSQDAVTATRDLVKDVKVPDGMTVDCHGNIYLTEHSYQQVRVFNPEGQQIATIKTDANVTNATFGGNDGKNLYLTGAGVLWKLPLDVTGISK